MQTFMPFVAMAGATGLGGYTPDYFGFRNHLGDKIYFSPHTRPLIVMTGNSELAGSRHPKDIASLLEDELRRRGIEFDVLNLAVNSYSLAGEIGAYVHFGDKTCPSLVIAHSGGIEYQYGMAAPAKFRWLGLAYHPPLEEWAYRMYNLRDYTGPSVWRQRDPNARLDETVAATELLLDQYRSIVERNGKTKFLFGAQKIGPIGPLFTFWTKEARDEFMPPLDLSKCGGGSHVIDYARSQDKDAALDVALGASCRLFVGHSSGFHGRGWHPADGRAGAACRDAGSDGDQPHA